MIKRYGVYVEHKYGGTVTEEETDGEWVKYEDYQADLDRVIGETVRFARGLCNLDIRVTPAAHEFLQSPLVQSWRARRGKS